MSKPKLTSHLAARSRKNRKARRRPETKFPERLDWLTRSLLGIPAFKDNQFVVLSDVVCALPYQLLSAIGGTLLEAKLQQASKAVFVVHEFRTFATVDAKLDANANALNCFFRLLLSADRGCEGFEIRSGQIVGPVSITEKQPHPSGVYSHSPMFFLSHRGLDLIGFFRITWLAIRISVIHVESAYLLNLGVSIWLRVNGLRSTR